MLVRDLVLTLAACAGLAAAPVFAQHHHDSHAHRTPWHKSHVIVDPHGHHVTEHHEDYHHVIPPQQHNHGTYYTNNDTHYFYQAPPVVYRPGTRVAQRPATPVQPTALEFGSFSHVDDLSGRLATMANELCLELHHNYGHNPGFAPIYAEAYQILDAAKYAHSKEHQGDRAGLARTLGGLDPLFHHVQEEMAAWNRDEHKTIGQLTIDDKLQQMEALLHHTLFDVGVKPQHDEHATQAPPPGGGGVEQAPPPGTLQAPRP
jgi:hypothetical protein